MAGKAEALCGFWQPLFSSFNIKPQGSFRARGNVLEAGIMAVLGHMKARQHGCHCSASACGCWRRNSDTQHTATPLLCLKMTEHRSDNSNGIIFLCPLILYYLCIENKSNFEPHNCFHLHQSRSFFFFFWGDPVISNRKLSSYAIC